MQKNFELRETLPYVNKPGRYLGHEYNTTLKTWNDAKIRCALVFPDLYEIGMSHQGLQILYHILNSKESILAERCYCPDNDMEELLRAKGLPLLSLENKQPLSHFDLIGITLPYELCYTNILTILDLAAIPLWAKDRDDNTPIILGGGSCSLNPEPVADFFDAILLGDGEEAIVEITNLLKTTKEAGISRKEQIEQLASIEGVYIPSSFKPTYSASGVFSGIRPVEDDTPPVRRRIVSDISATDHLLHPLVPNSRIVHDRLGIEVARGCTRGCRFCQAGIIYRPVRERSPEQIFELACTGIDHSGFDEMALLSLSTGDYSCLSSSLPQLMNRFADEAISVSMPSMRVGTLTPELMDEIKRVRKTGFTLAPEAGSERLRRVINKGISEEDLLHTSRDAFGLGWKVMKLYFMIGLPTETDDDIEAIAELAKKTKKIGNEAAPGRQQINVSVGTFVPKPHTPFQWEAQISMKESIEKIRSLKRLLPRKGINLKWHDPEQSFLEGVFSRGDRRLALLIERAWKDGARLDGWSDYFDLDRWQRAAVACDITMESYLQAKEEGGPLPWEHLQSGVDTSFLLDELHKGKDEKYTPDCRYHRCQKCGLCDFKQIQPVVINRKRNAPQTVSSEASTHTTKRNKNNKEDLHFRYMVHYSRLGDISYLGHLEILQVIFRVLRRAKIKTNFSKGFNPSPKVSFGPALPVGTSSESEYFIMDLPAPLSDFEQTRSNLNKQMPPGLLVTSINIHHGAPPQHVKSSYSIQLHPALTNGDMERLQSFTNSKSFTIQRTRKGKTKEIDIRQLIPVLSVNEKGNVNLDLISRASEAGVKPMEAIAAIIGKKQEEYLSSEILKRGWQEL